MQINIFIGFQQEYSKICLARYKEKENNFFFDGTGKNYFENKLQKIHCCEFVNKYIDLPLKSIWFNDFSELHLNTQDNICFIFSKSQSWLLQYKKGNYIERLRNKYPNCKILLYLWDLISSYYRFDVSFFREKCDAVLTYDLGDAEKYELVYSPIPYSPVKIIDDHTIKEFDVYFCGKAKNRLQDIYDVYLYLKQNNLKCCFFVMDVPKKQQKFKGEITYNKTLSYYRNLQYLQKARFMLDIVQKGSSGDTLRIKEAVAYGKKIITNNPNVKNNAYYSEKNICIFKKSSEINKNFLLNSKLVEYQGKNFNEFEKILGNIWQSVDFIYEDTQTQIERKKE